MAARSRARYLAPIALVASIAVTYLVVHDSLKSKHASTTSHSVVLPARTTTGGKKPAHRSGVYVVKSGDSLSVISARTGVPVATLESLNPGIDPNALQTGQRLTLRK
jgi:LysM repeat protein